MAVAMLRTAIGAHLRDVRTIQRRSLRDVAEGAHISLGHLSEVERGIKEPSSEVLAAVCTALGVPLSGVLAAVSVQLAEETPTQVVDGLRA